MNNRSLISRLRHTDWDFAGQYSESPFSAIHWYPGRYASQIPAALIGLLSEPGDLVLDPFVGSGTTLVEVQRLGRTGLGHDLNPVACLLARAKTLSATAEVVGKRIDDLVRDAAYELALGVNGELRTPPAGVQAYKWYAPRVTSDLVRLWSLIRSYDGVPRILGEVAFSAILLPVCRETRQWGYVCDNSTPKSDHAGDVLREYVRVLRNLALAYRERDRDLAHRLGAASRPPNVEVHEEDVRQGLRKLQSGNVKLVITSPPYFGVTDYVKAMRLTMEWFGRDIEPARLLEIGARSKRHRKMAYNEYLDDLGRAFEAVAQSLRKDAWCVVILGESRTRRTILGDVRRAITAAGLRLELTIKRNVSSQRRQLPSIMAEQVLFFVK